MFRISEFLNKEYPNPSVLVKSLPTGLVTRMMRDWVEAYEAGWRPDMYIESEQQTMHEFFKATLAKVDRMPDRRLRD